MEPVANESSEQKRTAPGQIPVTWRELLPWATGVMTTVWGAAYAVWKSNATDGQQMLLAPALLALVLFLLFVIMAWRARPSGSRRWLYTASIPFASLVYLAFSLVPSSPRSAPARLQKATTDLIESVKFVDVALTVRSGPDGKVRFVLDSTDVPVSAEVEVTSRHDKKLWTQHVVTHDCTREKSQTVCTLPALDYSPDRFMSISALDAMIKERTVVTYTPSEGCDHFAGHSLDLGIKLFLSWAAKLISVDVGHDNDDFTKMNPQHVAVIGSYDSYHTNRLLQACQQKACGPVVTLSSAAQLREFDRGQHVPHMYRLTSNNTARAVELARLLGRELDVEGKSRTIYIVYDDEGAGNSTDAVHYAADQARELQRAFAEGLLVRRPNLDVRWVRFRHNGGEGEGRLVFREGAPGEPEQLLKHKNFEDLVRSMRSTNDDPIKRVVFVARDFAIVQFGRAIQAEYANSGGDGDLLVHVPGPREVFEGVTRCLDRSAVDAALDHIIALSPYGSLDTLVGDEFKEAWRSKFPNEPVASRAARMFDALALVQDAVRGLDQQLRDQSRYVDVEVYRHELRHQLERASFVGASGSYSFRGGELAGSSLSCIYQEGSGLVPLPSLEELARPVLLRKPFADLDTL